MGWMDDFFMATSHKSRPPAFTMPHIIRSITPSRYVNSTDDDESLDLRLLVEFNSLQVQELLSIADITDFEDVETRRTSRRVPNDASDLGVGLASFATDIGDDELRESAYEILLAAAGDTVGLIVPTKEKKKEKRFRFLKKLGRGKGDQQSTRLVGLLAMMRVQMEVVTGLVFASQFVIANEQGILKHAIEQLNRIPLKEQRSPQERLHLKSMFARVEGHRELTFLQSLMSPIKRRVDKQLGDYHLHFSELYYECMNNPGSSSWYRPQTLGRRRCYPENPNNNNNQLMDEDEDGNFPGNFEIGNEPEGDSDGENFNPDEITMIWLNLGIGQPRVVGNFDKLVALTYEQLASVLYHEWVGYKEVDLIIGVPTIEQCWPGYQILFMNFNHEIGQYVTISPRNHGFHAFIVLLDQVEVRPPFHYFQWSREHVFCAYEDYDSDEGFVSIVIREPEMEDLLAIDMFIEGVLGFNDLARRIRHAFEAYNAHNDSTVPDMDNAWPGAMLAFLNEEGNIFELTLDTPHLISHIGTVVVYTCDYNFPPVHEGTVI